MKDEIRPQFQQSYEKYQRPLGAAVILAAVGTIPLILFEARAGVTPWVAAADWAIWAVFFVEYAFMMRVVQDPWSYARRHWLSTLVVILSFPALPHLLATVRVVRLARLARLVAVTARGLSAVRTTLASQGLVTVAAVTLLLTIAGGSLLWVVEPQTVNNDLTAGLWWAVVTMTTVGYGDIAPATTGGRLLAVVLMLSGLGLISTLAAAISAFFIGSEEAKDFDEMRERLARMERLIEEIAVAQRREAGRP